MQVAVNVIRESVLNVWRAICEVALAEVGSHSRNMEQVATVGPQLPASACKELAC